MGGRVLRWVVGVVYMGVAYKY